MNQRGQIYRKLRILLVKCAEKEGVGARQCTVTTAIRNSTIMADETLTDGSAVLAPEVKVILDKANDLATRLKNPCGTFYVLIAVEIY